MVFKIFQTFCGDFSITRHTRTRILFVRNTLLRDFFFFFCDLQGYVPYFILLLFIYSMNDLYDVLNPKPHIFKIIVCHYIQWKHLNQLKYAFRCDSLLAYCI